MSFFNEIIINTYQSLFGGSKEPSLFRQQYIATRMTQRLPPSWNHDRRYLVKYEIKNATWKTIFFNSALVSSQRIPRCKKCQMMKRRTYTLLPTTYVLQLWVETKVFI